MSWERVLGRVSFINCDPIFHSLPETWSVLSAPPSWLTGHLLRRDCITAPIPTYDYAQNQDELILIPEIGILGREKVGSVLLFGNRPIETMRDIAIPTDSSTSKKLLKWILNQKGLDPKLVEMGPDIDSMLNECDGALIIGDRAISAAASSSTRVILDLSSKWTEITGYPMVFGVFASRRDSPVIRVNDAREVMLGQYTSFMEDEKIRNEVIFRASRKVGLSQERVSIYYEKELSNILDNVSILGLECFLENVCGANLPPTWFASQSA